MNSNILLVIFILFWVLELNAFVEQRAALEVSRAYGIPFGCLTLPSWFGIFRFTWIIIVILIGYAFWEYPWHNGAIMLALYGLGMAFVPIPSSRYYKYENQVKSLMK